jgi:hypothetical protein
MAARVPPIGTITIWDVKLYIFLTITMYIILKQQSYNLTLNKGANYKKVPIGRRSRPWGRRRTRWWGHRCWLTLKMSGRKGLPASESWGWEGATETTNIKHLQRGGWCWAEAPKDKRLARGTPMVASNELRGDGTTYLEDVEDSLLK